MRQTVVDKLVVMQVVADRTVKGCEVTMGLVNTTTGATYGTTHIAHVSPEAKKLLDAFYAQVEQDAERVFFADAKNGVTITSTPDRGKPTGIPQGIGELLVEEKED